MLRKSYVGNNEAIFIFFIFAGGKVARGPDALSVLENETTRGLFYADLLEVSLFDFIDIF